MCDTFLPTASSPQVGLLARSGLLYILLPRMVPPSTLPLLSRCLFACMILVVIRAMHLDVCCLALQFIPERFRFEPESSTKPACYVSDEQSVTFVALG